VYFSCCCIHHHLLSIFTKIDYVYCRSWVISSYLLISHLCFSVSIHVRVLLPDHLFASLLPHSCPFPLRRIPLPSSFLLGFSCSWTPSHVFVLALTNCFSIWLSRSRRALSRGSEPLKPSLSRLLFYTPVAIYISVYA
jgi:hypothetical protein